MENIEDDTVGDRSVRNIEHYLLKTELESCVRSFDILR